MARVSGRATAEGTARFRRRALDGDPQLTAHFRKAPGDLWVSSIGLGTYIGDPDPATDRTVELAIETCLSSGRVNVFDTAINYRYQRAERSVGRALRQQMEAGKLRRDEVLVATKNGYFAPDAESITPIRRWVEVELIATGKLDRRDVVDGCHAMSVSYLTDQFERSRENLGLETIDLLYLHNAADAQIPIVGREEFERRLKDCFGLFERWRSEGSLGAYGLATWDCLRLPRSDPGHFPLERAVHIAQSVGGPSHGFRYVQFPFNLRMPEAYVDHNQSISGEGVSLLEAVRRLELGCFTSVPLFQGQLARIGPKLDGLSRAQTALQFARSAPGSLGPLVGQKQTQHLVENLEIADRPPWDLPSFAAALR